MVFDPSINTFSAWYLIHNNYILYISFLLSLRIYLKWTKFYKYTSQSYLKFNSSKIYSLIHLSINKQTSSTISMYQTNQYVILLRNIQEIKLSITPFKHNLPQPKRLKSKLFVKDLSFLNASECSSLKQA